MHAISIEANIVQRETFEGENFRGFRGLRAIHESFLCEIWGRATTTYDLFQAIRENFLHEIFTSYGSAKVFSLESFPLYGTFIPPKGCDTNALKMREYYLHLIKIPSHLCMKTTYSCA